VPDGARGTAVVLTRGRVGAAPRPPARPVLIYDGGCRFCRRWVERMRRLDRRAALDLIPLQAPEAVRVSGCSRDTLRRAVHLVRADGVVYAGASAVGEACRYLPGGRIVRAVLGVPGVMPVAERAYSWIARRWGPVGRRAIDAGTPDTSQNSQWTGCS
jgi:predicted DCC family thiol-disulfide oxidoreductase YuxK